VLERLGRGQQRTASDAARLPRDTLLSSCMLLSTCANQCCIRFQLYPQPHLSLPSFRRSFRADFFLADRDETEREKRHSRHDVGVVVVRCGRPRTVHLMGTSSRPSRYNLWTRLSATTAVLAVWITWSVANMIYRVVRSVVHSQWRDLRLVCLELLTCVL